MTEGTGANAVSTTTYTDNDGQAVLNLLYPSPGLVQYTWRQYDWNGNEVENALFSTDTNSAWSFGLNSYDGLNRLKSETSRDSATITYYRDPMGNVTNRLMPGGLQWSGIYDNAGQLLQEWNTGNSGLRERTNTYFYSAGLLRTNIDPVNDHGTYTYDDFQRLAATLHYLPDSDEWPLDTAYLYDPRGLITSIIESLWVFTETEVVRSYDAYGQLTGENTPIGVNAWANQAWDGAGRRVYLDFGYMAYRFGWQADGLLTNVTANGGSSSFTYDDAGRLVSRTTGQRQTTVASRDGAGRPLSVNTTVNGAAALSEALTWTSDGLINSHTLQRFGTAGFIDSRAYVYADLSRRLQQERCNIDATSRWTNSFAYDGGTAAGIGMLTKIDSGGAGGATWTSSPDSFSRPASETNVALRRLAYGRLNGTAAVTALLDNRPMPVEIFGVSDHNWTNQWRTLMDLTPGAHRLQVTAAHPSGLFTTNAAVWFTNNASAEIATDGFDAVGRLTQRVWRSPSGATNRNQGLYWDQKNRLSLTEETDALNNGYVVSSSYDGLNRRICYDYQPRTNGTLVNEIRVHTFSFDPATEFLELGVFVGTFTTGEINWKLYGPDLDGRYGGLNGTGGLEAIMPEVGPMRPVIADVRGNILGEVTNGVVSWNPSRPTGYGAVPGSRPVAFGFGAALAQASAWRGRCPDVTGYIWLGARYYNPESGTFLNSDPVWNGRDPNYYTFCGGDPINGFDPDGRCIENWAKRQYQNGISTFEGLLASDSRGQTLADVVYGQTRGAFNWALETAQGINNMQPGGKLGGYFNTLALDSAGGQGNQMINAFGTDLGAQPNSPAAQFSDAGTRGLLTLGSMFVGSGEARVASEGERALPEIEQTLMGTGRNATEEGTSVLFGQRRIGPAFSTGEGVPSYLSGRPIGDVAADLRSGVLSADQLPINAFTGANGELITINNRTLGALSEAGLQPTRINMVTPTRNELLRLTETPIINSPIPGPSIPVTPSMANPTVLRVITIP